MAGQLRTPGKAVRASMGAAGDSGGPPEKERLLLLGLDTSIPTTLVAPLAGATTLLASNSIPVVEIDVRCHQRVTAREPHWRFLLCTYERTGPKAGPAIQLSTRERAGYFLTGRLSGVPFSTLATYKFIVGALSQVTSGKKQIRARTLPGRREQRRMSCPTPSGPTPCRWAVPSRSSRPAPQRRRSACLRG
jgi:hypothetical protein